MALKTVTYENYVKYRFLKEKSAYLHHTHVPRETFDVHIMCVLSMVSYETMNIRWRITMK